MLLQTNSYVVAKDKRAEHERLMRRFRQTLARLGCDQFEVYEQVGANWSGGENGRYVQIMRFRDRKHQLAVQSSERSDPAAQALIAEFCTLVNFQYQQQQGLFAVGFYNSTLPVIPARPRLPRRDGRAEEPPLAASDAPALDEPPAESQPLETPSGAAEAGALVAEMEGEAGAAADSLEQTAPPQQTPDEANLPSFDPASPLAANEAIESSPATQPSEPDFTPAENAGESLDESGGGIEQEAPFAQPISLIVEEPLPPALSSESPDIPAAPDSAAEALDSNAEPATEITDDAAADSLADAFEEFLRAEQTDDTDADVRETASAEFPEQSESAEPDEVASESLATHADDAGTASDSEHLEFADDSGVHSALDAQSGRSSAEKAQGDGPA